MAVTLKFRLTEDDMKIAAKYAPRGARNRFWTWLLCIFFAALSLDLMLFGGHDTGRTIIALGGVLFGFLAVTYYEHARSAHEDLENWGVLEYVFSKESVWLRFKMIEHRIPWDHYRRVQELPTHFLLIAEGRDMVIVPKSAFESQPQMDEFRRLTENIRQSIPARQGSAR